MRIRHLVPVLVALTVGLAGCSGGGSDGKDGTVDTSKLQARLTTAKKALDEAETITLSLATKNLPDGVTGLLSAKGQGNHSPAFKGKVTVNSGGSSISADVVAIGGKVYAKTGLAPTFLDIDPASLQAPDPAALFSPTDGITQILAKTESLKEDGKSRDGKDVLTTITGTLRGTVVKTIIPSAASDKTFTVAYRLDDDDNLRDATLSGPFYLGGDTVTYTVTLTTSDTPVTIKKP